MCVYGTGRLGEKSVELTRNLVMFVCWGWTIGWVGGFPFGCGWGCFGKSVELSGDLIMCVYRGGEGGLVKISRVGLASGCLLVEGGWTFGCGGGSC